MIDLTIRRIRNEDNSEWLRMRKALWPETTSDEHQTEMDEIFADPVQPTFFAVRQNRALGGFLEAGTRKYAQGCDSKPVGYIEGWHVDEDLRGKGLGKALVQAAEDCARAQGLTGMASDTWLDNDASVQAHLKSGYEEVERLVHFVKKL